MAEGLQRLSGRHCVSPPTRFPIHNENSGSTSGPAVESPMAARQSLQGFSASFVPALIAPLCGPTCSNRPIRNSSAVTGFDPELTRLMNELQDATRAVNDCTRALGDCLRMRGYA